MDLLRLLLRDHPRHIGDQVTTNEASPDGSWIFFVRCKNLHPWLLLRRPRRVPLGIRRCKTMKQPSQNRVRLRQLSIVDLTLAAAFDVTAEACGQEIEGGQAVIAGMPAADAWPGLQSG